MTEEQIHRAAKVIVKDDEGEHTLVEYLKLLLTTLWNEAEQFSGKRPFGNSSWQFDVYKALIAAELVPGKLDEDGCVQDVDTEKADKLVLAVIKRMNVKSGEYKEEPAHQRMGL